MLLESHGLSLVHMELGGYLSFLLTPGPLMRASPAEIDLSVDASASKPPLPLLSVDPRTGIVTLCGDAPPPSVPSSIPSDSAPLNAPAEMDTIPSGDGNAHPAQPPAPPILIARAGQESIAKEIVGMPLSRRRLRRICSTATNTRKARWTSR